MTALRRAVRAARHRVGRRGASLLFFAELDLIYGYALAFPPTSGLSVTNRFFASLLPLDFWAGLWTATGLVCLVCAFRRYDRPAFMAAIALKVLWGGFALIGVWFADVPVASGAVWISLAGLVWILSGWREAGQDADDRADAQVVIDTAEADNEPGTA